VDIFRQIFLLVKTQQCQNRVGDNRTQMLAVSVNNGKQRRQFCLTPHKYCLSQCINNACKFFRSPNINNQSSKHQVQPNQIPVSSHPISL